MKTNDNTTAMDMEAPRTEQDILDAMREFALVSYQTVGADATCRNLKFLTKVISESPETYQKITNPDTVEKLQKLIASRKNGNMGMMEIMSVISEVSTILS
ncbi:hypothetical protein [Dyadobacter sp. 676]|uniref:Uncharacterized protein n=1 Tax=Dyadobacter sp. 676 TaxID=3088362 RepID=A0AAU8FM90_9BACT